MDFGLGSCHVRPSFAKSVIHDLRSFCHVLYRHRPKLAVHTPRRRIDSLIVRHQALVQLPLPSTCCGRLHQASEALLQATKGIVSQDTVDLGRQECQASVGAVSDACMVPGELFDKDLENARILREITSFVSLKTPRRPGDSVSPF